MMVQDLGSRCQTIARLSLVLGPSKKRETKRKKISLTKRNDVSRTVTETLSPVSDLGQDKNEENGTASNGKADEEKYDTLELRNR